jgi:hypothetical protein
VYCSRECQTSDWAEGHADECFNARAPEPEKLAQFIENFIDEDSHWVDLLKSETGAQHVIGAMAFAEIGIIVPRRARRKAKSAARHRNVAKESRGLKKMVHKGAARYQEKKAGRSLSRGYQ